MPAGLPAETLVAFLLGAAVAAILVLLLKGRQTGRARQMAAAAEATAAAEGRRRREAEAELEAAQRDLRELDRRLAASAERESATRDLLAEQKRFALEARRELESSFQALAAAALKGSSEQFLALAQEKLSAARSEAAADLEQRKKAVETLVSPLRETLEKLESSTRELETSRREAYARIDQHVRLLSRATEALRDQTTTLATALRSSQVRGRWGEIALRNIAELAGMTAHCDFEEQATAGDGGRPDMTVRLPGGRLIAIDAKAPLDAYLQAAEATDEAARQGHLDAHVRALRGHVRTLAGRDYAAALGADVDLVVLFLPGDPFLSAAFARDPDLQVEALRSKVLVATPTTLVALLRTVAIYWQQHSMAENARLIFDFARELYERAAKFGAELAGVRKGLKAALESYNRAVGSFEKRFLPMGRKLEEMRIAEQSRRQLESPPPIDPDPRLPPEPPKDDG